MDKRLKELVNGNEIARETYKEIIEIIKLQTVNCDTAVTHFEALVKKENNYYAKENLIRAVEASKQYHTLLKLIKTIAGEEVCNEQL